MFEEYNNDKITIRVGTVDEVGETSHVDGDTVDVRIVKKTRMFYDKNGKEKVSNYMIEMQSKTIDPDKDLIRIGSEDHAIIGIEEKPGFSDLKKVKVFII